MVDIFKKLLPEVVKKEKIIDKYDDVVIKLYPGETLPKYEIPVIKPSQEERDIISALKEIATRIITIQPYQIRDELQKRTVYAQKIKEIIDSTPELKIPKARKQFYIDAVVSEMVGYGIIDPLIHDDKLEEIMIIGEKRPVYVYHREHGMLLTNLSFLTNQEIVDLANKIAMRVGRRVDLANPILDARLPDGSRVNATIPPAAVGGATITIRKFRKDPFTIVDLIENKTINFEVGAFIWTLADGLGAFPANILITGGIGSGKTTLLNVLASFIRDRERIITIEDTAELNLPLEHWVRLEARPPGLEGEGEITLEMLTKNAIRMRPDRIVVGEVRGAEAFSLFTAMNTGQQGSLGTIHSNSAEETITRVTSPPMNVPLEMFSALDFIVVIQRISDPKKGMVRRVDQIAEVPANFREKRRLNLIYKRDPFKDRLKKKGRPEFFSVLEDFTGITSKKLDLILKKRENFLKDLVKKKTREMPSFKEALRKHILKEFD